MTRTESQINIHCLRQNTPLHTIDIAQVTICFSGGGYYIILFVLTKFNIFLIKIIIFCSKQCKNNVKISIKLEINYYIFAVHFLKLNAVYTLRIGCLYGAISQSAA